MSTEHVAIRDSIWRRALAPRPARLCDDQHEWKNHWRRLKKERRQRLLTQLEEEFGLTRRDFPTTSWAEMWDDVTDASEIGDLSTRTVEDYEYHLYMQNLAERDD